MQPHQLKGHDCRTAGKDVKEAMGCDKPLPSPRLVFEGINLDRCPGFYLKETVFLKTAFDLHRWREKGFLPYPGTWTDQPNIIIEIIDFVERLMNEQLRIENKRMKR